MDISAVANQIHQQSFEEIFPGCAVVTYAITDDTADAVKCLGKYVSPEDTAKSWMHATPSCLKGATCNLTHGDVDAFCQGTKDVLAVMKAMDPQQYTMEQIVRILRYMPNLPNARKVRMGDKCDMQQERVRCIVSKIPLDLPDYEGPRVLPTPQEKFGSKYNLLDSRLESAIPQSQ